MTAPRTLGLKQREGAQGDWFGTLEHLRANVDRGQVEAMIDAAADELRARLPELGARPAFGWSGGKDSQVLQVVCEIAGINDCVLAITDLEYPAFLAWATDNMPHGLHVIRREWNLDWLANHADMLFPSDARTAARWFSGVQHHGQRRYCREQHVDVLLQGRRRADGNYISRDGADHYRDRNGFVRWSPLADWTHEQVLAVIAARDIPLAPCYGWPRGFQVGTGSWPARQWCATHDQGWAEVHTIDPAVVEQAALVLPEAAAWLEHNGAR